MVNIKSISWKNFLSTGNQPIQIDFNNTAHQLSLCTGKNGAGKSQMACAFCFAFYGCAYRDVGVAQLVNTINKKEMLVIVDLEANGKKYRIVRGLEPRILEIWQDGVKVDYGVKKQDGQEFIEKRILKMDFKTFIQTTILGSNGYVPFMKLNAAERRKMIENLLVLDIFTEMLGVLKVKVAGWDQELHKTKVEIDSAESKIKFATSHLSDAKKQYETELQSLNEKEASNEEQLKTIQNDLVASEGILEKLRTEIDPVSKEVKRIREFESIKTQFDREIKKTTTELNDLNDNHECPSCKQKLSEDIRTRLVEEKTSRLDELKTGYSKLSTHMAEMSNKETQYARLRDQIGEHQNRIASLQATLVAIRQWLKQTEDSKVQLIEKMHKCTGTDSQMAGMHEELEAAKTKEKAIQDELRYAQLAQEFLKDSGLRARVIQRYLPLFNQLINKHLGSLGLFVQFALDENFNEKLLAGFREEFSYGSFSEGEKFRIDMAILFTWREVARLRSGVSTNLIVFDEVLDSSMDLDGMVSLIAMLRKLEDTSTVIVTHKFTEQVRENFDRVIEFSKTGHWSAMKTIEVAR